ncbi:MAG: ABC transporter ATP-binding protein, partial [Burkholderiaceae bacterium]
SALDMVLMGRAVRLPALASPSGADRALANACLERLGIAALAPRLFTELSGGERQLVLIARALAQEPALLIMDEPTASLDFGNQIRVLEQIGALRAHGMAVLLSTHQPEHALQVADRIALLGRGGLQAVGSARATATARALATLYGVPCAAIEARLFRP